MAITSLDIQNVSFSIDRKGYDVDEVDEFLEHVADEIDALNNLVASLQDQLSGQQITFPEGDFEDAIEPEEVKEEPVETVEITPSDADKDDRIAQLEAELETSRKDGSAISQALIVAQRAADDLLANADMQAGQIVADAQNQADDILAKAEEERQLVIDEIARLESDREETCKEYTDVLRNFVTDANNRLDMLNQKSQSYLAASAHARPQARSYSPYQVPYAAPGEPASAVQDADAVASPATPATTVLPLETAPDKDLSGFGDTDDFEFEEID